MTSFTLHDLEKRVKERAAASAEVSYTRKLLDRGVAHCAKKLGEEAIETALAAVGEERERLFARWPNTPRVDLVTTDGFLYPNAVLEREGLMERKGFPESYDLPALLRFLTEVKAGRHPVRAPVYSHLVYDVKPNEWVV